MVVVVEVVFQLEKKYSDSLSGHSMITKRIMNLILYAQIDSSFWFDTINFGWSIQLSSRYML